MALLLLQQTGISLGWLIGVQLFLGIATDAIYPVLLLAAPRTPAAEGTVAIGDGLAIVGRASAALSPVLLGVLVSLSAGASPERPRLRATLYFLAALQLLTTILMALFTRETIGVSSPRPRPGSRGSCDLPLDGRHDAGLAAARRGSPASPVTPSTTLARRR